MRAAWIGMCSAIVAGTLAGVALENFAADVDGEEWFVRIGDIVPAGHKLVKGREHLLEPYDAPPKVTVADGKS